jgi:2-succinyl-5-enolpyruvyl-6-hydroxy-3-cyclohexene-1-carboxylate synthase
VCTSGTATANYLPAIVEASQSGLPLIALTSDRPPSLRGTGANQTIDQRQLYGAYARLFVDAGVPRAHTHATEQWRALARQILRASSTGPVHLNLAFDEPLVPTGAEVDLGRRDLRPAQRAQTPVLNMGAVGEALASERGIVIAGQIADDAEPVAELAERLGWPLIAEPLSGLRLPGRALAAGQALLADERFAEAHAPEVVLQFGGTPTTRATQRFVEAAERLVVVGERAADPSRKASKTVAEPEGAVARALAGVVSQSGDGWLEEWLAADRVARAALDAFLDAEKQPFELRVARDVAAAAPVGTTLVVSSSTPVRDLDHAMAPREGLRVLANRGASGIDGFVSTVLGIASGGAPTVALTGDLSLLHDASGFLWSARRGEPVTFVVLNNDGGGIFDLLPSAKLPEHETLFVTPHGVDLRALAEATGVGYERVNDPMPLVQEEPKVTTLVEVPIDRARAVRRRKALQKAIAKALNPGG